MTSLTAIAKMALGHIGVSVTLNNVETDTSKEARDCRTYLDQCRDRILEQADWSFARNRKTLSTSGITVPDGWTYAYDYPADCLYARTIINKYARTPGKGEDIKFALYEDGGNKYILCDEADAVLEFTKKITNPGLFSHMFIECYSWDLAAHVAGPLRADPALKKEAAQNAILWINAAASASINEQREDDEPDSEFVTGRL